MKEPIPMPASAQAKVRVSVAICMSLKSSAVPRLARPAEEAQLDDCAEDEVDEAQFGDLSAHRQLMLLLLMKAHMLDWAMLLRLVRSWMQTLGGAAAMT